MGTRCGRILFENHVLLSDTAVFVSSEQLQFPKTYLRDPLRSKRWRTKLGWNVDSELNDQLDFTEGTSGAAVAVIAAGNYPTGALMAQAVEDAMNAAATDNTYTVSYNGVTGEFTIARATGTDTIDLDWSTGPNAAFSVGEDLGFDTSADDTGLTTYVGDLPAYGSRAWIKFDFGTGFASLPVTSLIAFDGNFIATTVVTVQANATDSWGAPTFSTTLSLDSVNNDFVKAISFIDEETFRYWRFVIHDVQNPDGFTELGVPYVGDYFEPENGYSQAFTEDRSELSTIEAADQGATYQAVAATRRMYPLTWLGENEADKNVFLEFAKLVKVGFPFFMALEATVDIQNTLYVMLDSPMQRVFQAPTHWRFSTDMSEVLG